MRKEWIIGIIAIILILIGVIAGIYSYKINNTKDSNKKDDRVLATNQEKNVIENILVTSAIEKRVSPNAKMVEKQYFNGCNHLITTVKDLPLDLANCNEEELEQKCTGWDVQEMENNEIVLYQEKEGFCNQHYLIKEHNGVLGIYTTDENGNETFKEDTDIQTMYFTEADLDRISNGIEAIGDIELNSVLEDFE